MSQPTGWGGYRRPSNPAPVSNPGAGSRRTDGQPIRDLPNPDYGEGKEFRDLQRAAPLANAAKSAPRVNQVNLDELFSQAGVMPFDAPSVDPTRPVTDGAAQGPGAGMEALGLPADPKELHRADAKQLRRYLPAFINAASSDHSTPAFRAWVRQLIRYLS